jgi:Flp pilus assembly protein TadG
VRRHRLLKADRGSAAIDAIFAILFIITLVLGAIQVALVLYARNVVASSAHEAARALIELPADPGRAQLIARDTVSRAAGKLVDGLVVTARIVRAGDRTIAQVEVSGLLSPVGLLPVSLPVTTTATSSRVARP